MLQIYFNKKFVALLAEQVESAIEECDKVVSAFTCKCTNLTIFLSRTRQALNSFQLDYWTSFVKAVKIER